MHDRIQRRIRHTIRFNCFDEHTNVWGLEVNACIVVHAVMWLVNLVSQYNKLCVPLWYMIKTLTDDSLSRLSTHYVSAVLAPLFRKTGDLYTLFAIINNCSSTSDGFRTCGKWWNEHSKDFIMNKDTKQCDDIQHGILRYPKFSDGDLWVMRTCTPLVITNAKNRLRLTFLPLLQYLQSKCKDKELIASIVGGSIICAMGRMMTLSPPIHIEGDGNADSAIDEIISDARHGYTSDHLTIRQFDNVTLVNGLFPLDKNKYATAKRHGKNQLHDIPDRIYVGMSPIEDIFFEANKYVYKCLSSRTVLLPRKDIEMEVPTWVRNGFNITEFEG